MKVGIMNTVCFGKSFFFKIKSGGSAKMYQWLVKGIMAILKLCSNLFWIKDTIVILEFYSNSVFLN